MRNLFRITALGVTFFALACGTRTPLSNEPRSGLEASREALLAEGDAARRSEGPAYARPSSTANLISPERIPEATQRDLRFTSDLNALPAIGHVVHGFYREVGLTRIQLADDITFVDSAAFRRTIEAADTFPAVLLPHALEKLRRERQLVLPLLGIGSGRYLRAQSACVAPANAPCTRDVSDLLAGRSTGSGNLIAVVPTLRYDAHTLRLEPNQELRLTFHAVATGAPDGMAVAGGRCNLVPMESALSAAPGALVHPGRNRHLNEALNQALELYLARYAAASRTPILDFVRSLQVADCKLNAVAELQWLRQRCGLPEPRTLFLLPHGSGPQNRAVLDNTLDITTSNHLWNALAQRQANGTLELTNFVFWDRTPAPSAVLDYAFTGATRAALIARLDDTARAEDFTLGTALMPSTAGAIGHHETPESLNTAIDGAVNALVNRFAGPLGRAVRRPGETTWSMVRPSSASPVDIALTRVHFSAGRRGELATQGAAATPLSQTFHVAPVSFPANLRVLNFTNTDHRHYTARLVSARQWAQLPSITEPPGTPPRFYIEIEVLVHPR